jgi:hypothetical protein
VRDLFCVIIVRIIFLHRIVYRRIESGYVVMNGLMFHPTSRVEFSFSAFMLHEKNNFTISSHNEFRVYLSAIFSLIKQFIPTKRGS